MSLSLSFDCNKTECPNYRGCDRLPYVNQSGEVTCGIYLNYLKEKEYQALPVYKKLEIKLSQFTGKNAFRNISYYYKITVHISPDDMKSIQTVTATQVDLETDKSTFMGFPVVEDESTFIEISTKVNV